MNVSFLAAILLDVVSIVTQTGASRSWWSGKSKHKHWNWERRAKDPICSSGQCVLAWKCPDDAILREVEGSCPYWTNGPWVCCNLNYEERRRPHIPFESNPSTPSGYSKRAATNSWKEKTTTESYWSDDKHKTPPDPWNRNAREGSTTDTRNDPHWPVTSRPVYNTPKTPRPGNVRKTTEDNLNRRTTSSYSTIRTTRSTTPAPDSRIIFPRYDWPQKATKQPAFNTHAPKKTATPDYRSTTKAWPRPTTKTTWQPGRTVSTSTRRPSVPTRAWIGGSEERGRTTSTTVYPNSGRSTRTPNRPSTPRTTARTTQRNRITTPLPDVNTYMCGIRDQRSPIRNRQGRNYNLDYVEIINTESRSGNRRKPYQRIVGGEEVEPFSYPWVAALYKVASSGGHRFLSAGSLINEHFVLTAAHVFTPDDLRTASYVVMLGTHDAQDAVAEYLVASVVQHPNYEHRYYYHDIALLRLVRPVVFNNYVMPVCLPSPNAPLLRDSDLEGKNVTVMGWGDESFGGKSSRVLKEATFPIVSRASCNASYIRVASNRFPRGITEEMLCAGDPKGGKDACQGDSGGPLTSIERGRYTQVGIVSFGYQCGDKEYPGVYTKVAPYLSWIAENTRSTKDYVNDYDYRG